jgi:hypothetical protein
MSDKQEEAKDDSKKIGPGDLLSFGSVKLLFTLKLDKTDLTNHNIKWDELESLSNLQFLRESKDLWKRVELSSINDTLSILLQINRSSKKLVKIGYVGFKKITYKDEQVDFYDFVEGITRQNGLYITSCDVCKSIVSIQLLLKYKNKQKIFLLSGESTPITKEEKKENDNKEKDNKKKEENTKNNEETEKKEEENKNENINNEDMKQEKENKSEEEDQENPLTNITDDVIKPSEFNYIYVNFGDYYSGEFKGRVRVEHLYEFFQHLKTTTRSKIILNLNEDEIIKTKDDNNKDLLSIVDMYIFYNKNKLYDILKKMKEQEDQSEIKKIYEYHYNDMKRRIIEKEESKEKEKSLIKNYKDFLEREKGQKRINHTVKKERTNLKMNRGGVYITQSNTRKDSDIERINQLISIDNKRSIDVKRIGLKTETNKEDTHNNYKTIPKHQSNIGNYKIKLTPIRPPRPTPLNKKDMFDYFKTGICDKDPQRRPQEKVALVLDEFKKLFFIKCNKKDEKPSVLDFDLQLYPKMNLRNMKEILESKKFIQSNFDDYINVFFGSVLSTIVSRGQEGCEENSLFLSYLLATNTIKKLVEIQKYNLPMPKNKDFFISSINKGEVKKILTEANKRRKEQLFVLDGNSKTKEVIKPYNPLLDKNLVSFFSSRNNQNFLKLKGFIGKGGEIMYDPIYRETLITNTNPRNTRVNNFSLGNKRMFNSIQNKKNKKIKDNKKNKKLKYKSMTTNRFLYGFRRRSPGYSIYNQTGKSGIVLPPITQEKKLVKKLGSKEKEKKKIIESGSEESGSRSGNEDDDGGSRNGSEN